MADDDFEKSKHVPKTEKRRCVFKDDNRRQCLNLIP